MTTKKIIDITAYDKLPPQALELEKAVLGACMIDNEAVAVAVELLTPEHFYTIAHQDIFEAILQLFKQSQPIDTLTVPNKMESNGTLKQAGGLDYIFELVNSIYSGAHVETHCRIVIQKYIAREIIRNAVFATKEAHTDTLDVFELLDDLTVKLIHLRGVSVRNKLEHINIVANDNIKEIIAKSKVTYKKTAILTGLDELDDILGGLQPQLYIIAGRPGSGKSSFATSIINYLSIDKKKRIALFSLEMTKEQVELRLKTIRTSIPNIRLLKGEIRNNEWEILFAETNIISDSPIYIDDSSTLNIIDLRSKLISLKAKHDIDICIVDYIQRMTSAEKGIRDIRLITNEVSSGLARVSKELKIPVIALSQLSREVEKSKDKVPELHHLKESGNIEEDAYAVIFIYRPEYYGFNTFTDDNQHITSDNKVQLIVAKHRNGTLGAPIFTFDKSKMHFRNLYDNSSQFPVPSNRINVKGNENDFKEF